MGFRGRHARFALLAAVLAAWLTGCSPSLMVVVDPLIHELAPLQDDKHLQQVVVDGEYPWDDELYAALDGSSISRVILSPLLYESGLTAAADFPDKQFYFITTDEPAAEFLENAEYVVMDRTRAMHELGRYVQEFVLARIDDHDGAVSTVLLYTGNERRRKEAEVLNRYMNALPDGSVRVREYSVLPTRSGIQNEFARHRPPHLFVALLESRTLDALETADQQDVPIVIENGGSVSEAYPTAAGSIEYEYPAAVRNAAQRIHQGKGCPAPEAKLTFYNNDLADNQHLEGDGR